MADDPRDWSAVRLAAGTELILGWRPRRSRLDAAGVDLSRKVAAEIRALCATTLEQLAGLARRPYGGSPYIEAGEEYLAVPATQLPNFDEPAGAMVGDVEEGAGLSDLQRLVGNPGLPSLGRVDMATGKYLFYAAICREAGTGDRIGFVRQTDPHRVARAGGFLAVLGQEGLQHFEDPVFVFEADFDLVVSGDEVAVLRLEAFNRMFADLNTITAAAPANARLVAEAIPLMTPEATEALASAAAAHPSMARRLQRLLRPGVLPKVTSKSVGAAMIKHGLDPKTIVDGRKIGFGEEHAGVFLDLIEQLYYETDFTGEHRRADRYSPLAP